jgi:hypothetical protein
MTETYHSLKEIYNYIKNERPLLQKEADEALDVLNAEDWIKKDSVLSDKDVWAMTTIAKYSPYLWT